MANLRTMVSFAAVALLAGCASPQVVTKTEVVEVVRERLVPVSEELTYSLDWPEMEVKVWRDIAVLSLHYRDRWRSCEARMSEIRGLHETR